ncbi:MAG: hypothetical protein QM758_18645 [Armatimonas sp.]
MSELNYMSWIGGVDLFAATSGSSQPNAIVHVARAVTTPLGTAPSGLIFFHPDPNAPPLFYGFICTDPEIGAYYGPKIFAGTPFENAPVLPATIEITETPTIATARVTIEGYVIETTLTGFGPMQRIDRGIGTPMPFTQQGVEAEASEIALIVNGEPIALTALPYSIELGGASVWSPGGTYTH